MYPIWDFGSEEQKATLSSKDGKWRMDRMFRPSRQIMVRIQDMITKAEDMGDHYLLNGAKMDY